MQIYVDVNAGWDGDGTKERPYRKIGDAAKLAQPGDEVLVAPGVYREYVDPQNAGTEEKRITYKSIEPLKAVITGAEVLSGWQKAEGNIWTARVKSSMFGECNPYTTFVYGDWYFAGKTRHIGAVYLDNKMLYEAYTLEDLKKGEINPYSWDPESSKLQWFAEVSGEDTVFYVNLQGEDPNEHEMEINVRRQCFVPSKTLVSYITVSGFTICKAATNWAPPAAHQDCMVGPHWSKGWIIEDCDISNSKCSGIGLGKYLDPDNNHYFTYKHVKSPTQMERDAVCRGQYHGWLKEKVGSHIIRRNNIHHCEQGGIIGRMGGVFSIIEDNHIHHINNMMELGGAEIAGIKMHAAIDVTMRRNHIHNCTMGIWCDWEAQGVRISQNLLHDNQRPEFAKQLPGGMMSQDLFIEVSHGPTLIDNNVLLSDVSLRIASEGVAMVHNLICGAFTSVSGGCDSYVDGIYRQRFTPYHMPHRTEVMGFMTILHGDNRFYNNIFLQKWNQEDFVVNSDSKPDEAYTENRAVGNHVWDEYPTYEEWITHFDMDSDIPDMRSIEPAHWSKLPVWSKDNVYLGGAQKWKNDVNPLVISEAEAYANLEEKNGTYVLNTNIYDLIGDFTCSMVDSDILGKAFEPEQRFENPDSTDIVFDCDYFGAHRGCRVAPGPFAKTDEGSIAVDAKVWKN